MTNLLVKSPDNKLWKMKDTDERVSNYTIIGKFKRKILDRYIPVGHLRKCQLQELEDGRKYEIFSDWSAIELSC